MTREKLKQDVDAARPSHIPDLTAAQKSETTRTLAEKIYHSYLLKKCKEKSNRREAINGSR